MYAFDKDSRCYLAYLCIGLPFRDLGIGSTLLEHYHQYVIRETSCTNIYLASLPESVRFYRRKERGYKKIGTSEGIFRDEANGINIELHGEILMRKNLSRLPVQNVLAVVLQNQIDVEMDNDDDDVIILGDTREDPISIDSDAPHTTQQLRARDAFDRAAPCDLE